MGGAISQGTKAVRGAISQGTKAVGGAINQGEQAANQLNQTRVCNMINQVAHLGYDVAATVFFGGINAEYKLQPQPTGVASGLQNTCVYIPDGAIDVTISVQQSESKSKVSPGFSKTISIQSSQGHICIYKDGAGYSKQSDTWGCKCYPSLCQQ